MNYKYWIHMYNSFALPRNNTYVYENLGVTDINLAHLSTSVMMLGK